MRHIQRLTLWQIFAAPLLVAVLSSFGLVAALVGDGWWDLVSWITLGATVAKYLSMQPTLHPHDRLGAVVYFVVVGVPVFIAGLILIAEPVVT